MTIRTYGWVQNPSDFKKLQKVVQIFDSNSDQYTLLRDELVAQYIHFDDIKNNLQDKLNAAEATFSYLELVGTSRGPDGGSPNTRSEAVADSLIQITVEPQSSNTSGKKWTDNWTADGFLRWALSLNFVTHDRNTDTCSITPTGLLFASSESESIEETDELHRALLSYPPATQILRLLNVSGPMTKFGLGGQLGFPGEAGFTSYDEGLMIDWLSSCSPEERQKIRSDVEGTSDKYARMISGWLVKVGFVNTERTTLGNGITGFQRYSITARGIHALRQTEGHSRNPRIEKYLTWEFLATSTKNRDYVRSRRAYILKTMQRTKSMPVLLARLSELGFDDPRMTVESDISSFITFGLKTTINGDQIELLDEINDFSIPNLNLTEALADSAAEKEKARIKGATVLPSKYYELLDIAYDGKRSRDFEIMTAELLRNCYSLETKLLGDGRRPDIVSYTSEFGLIIDTKAYSKGYSKSITEEDKMVRYIEENKNRCSNQNPTEWWSTFPEEIPSDQYYFLWASSKFIGQFHSQLESTSQRTGASGSAINVEQLLLGASAVLTGDLCREDLPSYFLNKEIFWDISHNTSNDAGQ